MSLNKEKIKHVAKLARISVNEAKVDSLTKDLNSIFKFIEKLNELNTDKVEPLTSILNQSLRSRKDEINDGKIREKIFSQAGEHFAYLHKNQYSHGGLALRDICWDGKKATFLDFEKFRDNIAKTKKLSVDFYYFIHSWFKLSDKAGPELLSFVNSYKAASDKILWQEVLNMPKRYNILEKISLMVNTKNKDIIAFQRAIEFLKVEN